MAAYPRRILHGTWVRSVITMSGKKISKSRRRTAGRRPRRSTLPTVHKTIFFGRARSPIGPGIRVEYASGISPPVRIIARRPGGREWCVGAREPKRSDLAISPSHQLNFCFFSDVLIRPIRPLVTIPMAGDVHYPYTMYRPVHQSIHYHSYQACNHSVTGGRPTGDATHVGALNALPDRYR